MLMANDVLQFLGGIYLGLGALLILLIFVFTKGTWRKLLLVVVVLGLFSWWPVSSVLKSRNASEVQMAKMKPIYERFDLLCKGAGEKIFRTVENVEGIFLIKVRPMKATNADVNSMSPGAAMTGERTADGYIGNFLFYENRHNHHDQRGHVSVTATEYPGYRYVDVIDEVDGRRYRYTAPFVPRKGDGVLNQEIQRTLTNEPLPEYGVTYIDLVDPQDRKFWIAGTKIQIVRNETKEIIAEQTSYLMDSGQGGAGGERDPWSWAASYGPRCPKGMGGPSHTRFFVDQILKPKKAE